MSLLFVALTGTSPSMGGGGGGGGLATAATGALLFGELPPVAFDIGFHLQVVVILFYAILAVYSMHLHSLSTQPAHTAPRVSQSPDSFIHPNSTTRSPVLDEDDHTSYPPTTPSPPSLAPRWSGFHLTWPRTEHGQRKDTLEG